MSEENTGKRNHMITLPGCGWVCYNRKEHIIRKEECNMKKLGFIGMGNMGQAIAAGMLRSGLIGANQIYAYAPHQDKLRKNAREIGFVPCTSLKELVNSVDTVLLACKPYQIDDVLGEVRDDLAGKALLSVAAGWPYEKFREKTDSSTRIQYIGTNTPSMVGEGVLIFQEENSLEEEERKFIFEVFEAMGTVLELPGRLMDIGAALTGCAPAFMAMVMEAMGDAGVKYGVPRAQAYTLVAQMMLGSAKLQLETGSHPGILKDQVCSPAGTTIRGVDALEHAGMRAAFMDAVDAVMNKK